VGGGREEGADVVYGGEAPEDPALKDGFFIQPTPLSAFATTREDVGYLLENRGPA
jgi:hypothetical protein